MKHSKKSLNKYYEELHKHYALKAELIAEYGEPCMICNDLNRDFRGISLSHIIAKSRGGKTEIGNVELLCYPCHEYVEKHPELRQKKEE